MFIQQRIFYLKISGYIILFIALLTLIGWQFNITAFKSFSNEMTAMNPLTAVTFIVSGYWLIINQNNKWDSKISSVIPGLIILLVGISHALAHLFLWEWLRFWGGMFFCSTE